MIARLWKTSTKNEDADEFSAYLHATGIRDVGSASGSLGVFVLRRQEETTEFIVLSLWESEAAIEEFAGPDIDKTRYYPKDGTFLLEMPETVAHYQVLVGPVP